MYTLREIAAPISLRRLGKEFVSQAFAGFCQVSAGFRRSVDEHSGTQAQEGHDKTTSRIPAGQGDFQDFPDFPEFPDFPDLSDFPDFPDFPDFANFPDFRCSR